MPDDLPAALAGCEHRPVTATADRPPTIPDERPEPDGRYRLAPMRPDDVPEIGQVERRCFTNPWPLSAYRRELQHPEQNHYVVLRSAPVEDGPEEIPEANGGGPRSVARRTLLPLGLGRRPEPPPRARIAPVVGFAGMWTAFDEAHITTIAIDAPYRGRGLGEVLLATLFDEADRRGATWMTLEVRVSNESAQALYRKWGFAVQGTRRRYYSDNNEDAHIMWSRALSDAAYRAELAEVRASLAARLAGAVDGFSPRMAERPAVAAPPAPWETGGRV